MPIMIFFHGPCLYSWACAVLRQPKKSNIQICPININRNPVIYYSCSWFDFCHQYELLPKISYLTRPNTESPNKISPLLYKPVIENLDLLIAITLRSCAKLSPVLTPRSLPTANMVRPPIANYSISFR